MKTNAANVINSSAHINVDLSELNSNSNPPFKQKKMILFDFNKNTNFVSQEIPLYTTSTIFDIIYKTSNLTRNTSEKNIQTAENKVYTPVSNLQYIESKSDSKLYEKNAFESDGFIFNPNLKTLSSKSNQLTSDNRVIENPSLTGQKLFEILTDSSQDSQLISVISSEQKHILNNNLAILGSSSTSLSHLQAMNGPVHNSMISSQNYLQQAQLQSESNVYMQKSEKDAIQQTYSSSAPNLQNSVETLTTQKAVAFLAGPRERIYVLGNPIDYCLRCHQEGLGQTSWRPHRHIGELKIRYICERHFDDWESNHHIDIPLCPICSQVLYLYELNVMLGVSNARRLHKYVLKCASRHILPLLDLFCQTKKGGERCNANFKLQWCYGTMVKRCELQKNRDHDLWWVRYKNEWKQRRTVIRYKKDFLSHLTDAQRSLLLGLGLEGEAPPDPKLALGPAFDTLVSSVNCSSTNSKIRKRNNERSISFNQIENCMNNIYNNHHKHPIRMGNDNFDFNSYSFTPPSKNLCHLNEKKNEVLQESSSSNFSENPYSVAQCHSMQYPDKFSIFSSSNDCEEKQSKELHLASNQQILFYEGQSSIVLDQIDLEYNQLNQSFNPDASNINSIVTGTPTSPLTSSNCYSVITSVVGNPVSNSNIN